MDFADPDNTPKMCTFLLQNESFKSYSFLYIPQYPCPSHAWTLLEAWKVTVSVIFSKHFFPFLFKKLLQSNKEIINYLYSKSPMHLKEDWIQITSIAE